MWLVLPESKTRAPGASRAISRRARAWFSFGCSLKRSLHAARHLQAAPDEAVAVLRLQGLPQAGRRPHHVAAVGEVIAGERTHSRRSSGCPSPRCARERPPFARRGRGSPGRRRRTPRRRARGPSSRCSRSSGGVPSSAPAGTASPRGRSSPPARGPSERRRAGSWGPRGRCVVTTRSHPPPAPRGSIVAPCSPRKASLMALGRPPRIVKPRRPAFAPRRRRPMSA